MRHPVSPALDALPHIERSDLADQIYVVLKEMLLKRELQPGQKLSAEELAARMGVSRTPVKDTINRLAMEGLVEIQPRRGTYVTALSPQDVSEVFDIRLLLEVYAAEQAIKLGNAAALAAKLKPLVAAMSRASAGNRYVDYARFIENDHAFHQAIVAASGNQRLTRIYESLGVHIQIARGHYVRNVMTPDEAQREHNDIVRAFVREDFLQARKALTHHILAVKAKLLAAIVETGV